MGEVSGLDREGVHLDEEIMFDEWVRECVALEQEERRNQDRVRVLSKDDGYELPEVVTEDSFRLLMETVGWD
ncbi:hypothetical protein [Alicyclobacillus acidoterrestris]|uniref:Uncharacterized protein n=1 Tax=Alicyclobacillus acidoterrestris (strain ATCC 49025 / DSM 3922 / CIP 106132 / NCIMB 13137 / GD3B) TaxID=1356854 RepID=T0CAE2_ALIAG|nr:hypothetical protein [Alicyclobacillus acidoterrestris]EPZ53083.1 hypothetical protein N007_18310 [Alicyclobacillus acidoterrestris ATCC 49025]UNO49379.1 hypothetical protein K1I37_02140 [Alicyclobacillus acidoterrestris]